MNDFYCCVMFPYPSGAGLHTGHYYNYAVMDTYCRWLRLQGQTVIQPFGYDAFGLPAENYAKQIGGDPAEVTWENIQRFRTQMSRMNTRYDERLVTCSPGYTKWTKWLFTRLKEEGLAYKAWGDVNFCPDCNTVLANEQVKDGKCDRCETKIETKNLNQWYFKITAYAKRLIQNLDIIDYPEGTKKQQRKWLENQRDWCVSRQRKWGCPIPIEGETDTLDTFVDSSFYYVRYLDSNNSTQLCHPDKYRQVDLYVGGPEHACMHLIYARFIHMFLFDIGAVTNEEPFKKVIHQGTITNAGSKMSKSKGNAVCPDNYNPDELRMHLMFLGPYSEGGDWGDDKMTGIKRFLGRMRGWLGNTDGQTLSTRALEDKINGYVLEFKFNMAIAELMKFYNDNKHKPVDLCTSRDITNLLKCFAPGFEI